MDTVRLDDVAAEVGIDFRHSAFRWGVRGDPNAMMGAGVCWIDVDGDGWLDLFAVNTWSHGEWGRWYDEGALPSTALFRNDRGRFTDITDEFGARLEIRGNGCVAADLDLDGHTDLYVTTERKNLLLWNDGGDRFEEDDGSAGGNSYGWQSGAAVGDVNGDGWPDLFLAGYANQNHRIEGAIQGFPNIYGAVADELLLSRGGEEGRPTFVDVASEAGIEADRVDYGLGALLTDVDRDGDLDVYVANDTQPNRLYVNQPSAGALGFTLVDRAGAAGVNDDGAGMGVAAADYDADGFPDLVVTNMTEDLNAVFRSTASGSGEASPFVAALDDMGLPELGLGDTGWGTTWADLDLDGDLDLVHANGMIPVTDLVADREQLRVFENDTNGATGTFSEATGIVGLEVSGRLLGRGLAAADYDNDGDIDLAVGTIGGDLALLRNTGAGGHWLVVDVEPASPGTRVVVTDTTGRSQERELLAGSSYLSSEDPRAHFGLGALDGEVTIVVRWPDGSSVTRSGVEVDQLLRVDRDDAE
ncbi:MAG: CRTAC1 family protein [Ilumatobacteraceae bacterium]